DIGSLPIFNWLLLGYGVPAVAFLGAGQVLRAEKDDMPSRLSDALGIVFAGFLFFFEIRHALNGGDVFARTTDHVEQGLMALTAFAFAFALMRAEVGSDNPVFRIASLAFGVVAIFDLGLGHNPVLSDEVVRGWPVLSSLMLAYLL